MSAWCRSTPPASPGANGATRSPRPWGADVLLLALDTSTAQVSVAFGDRGAVLGSVQLAGGRRHAEQLAPAIEYLRRECAVELDHLAAVAVGTGPGLFTGLRVGVTTAKVMAQALRIPVVGVPSLDLVAYPLRHSERAIVAVLDARRPEGFAARSPPGPRGGRRGSGLPGPPPGRP